LDCPAFTIGYESPASSQENNTGNNTATADESQAMDRSSLTVSGLVSSFIGNRRAQRRDRDLAEAVDYIDSSTRRELDWFCVTSSKPLLRVMATLDPLLISPNTSKADNFLSEGFSAKSVLPEDKFLVDYSLAWLRDVRATSNHTKSRVYRVFGVNSDGLGVFIPRFLKAIRPPSTLATRRGCLHLMSLLPPLTDSETYLGDIDLWCDNTQVWDVAAADKKERAVTLYNFLYYLHTSAMSTKRITEGGAIDSVIMLALGRSLDEGEAFYILLRKGGNGFREGSTGTSANDFLLVNPSSGYVYGAADPSCPLVEISCLATPSNLWANVQQSARPCAMSFDLQNARFWRPFFGVRFRAPEGMSSIQREVDLIPTPESLAVEIGDAVRDAIKLNFRRWRIKRKSFVTQVHQQSSMEVQYLLSSLEEWKRGGAVGGLLSTSIDGDPTGGSTVNASGLGSVGGSSVVDSLQRELRSRLATVLNTRVLRGFAVNLTFSDVESVMRKVKAYCVHETRSPEVQFVIGVRAFPLVQGLVSLWLFLGALEATSPSAPSTAGQNFHL